MKGLNSFTIAFLMILALPLAIVVSQGLASDDITPNDEFFTLSISGTPAINQTDWRLVVHGQVDNELNLTYDEFLALPNASVTATLQCVEGPSGRADWTGLPLSKLLEMAGLNDSAQEVVFHAADGYSSSLTVEDARSEGVMLAHTMNGETLPADHGFPLRLVAPEKYGYKWVKWITVIEVVDEDYKGYWERRGWDDDATVSTFSDWGPHAFLMSISFIVGGIALASGFKVSGNTIVFTRLPDEVTERLHKILSILFLVSMLVVFVYWSYQTRELRGDLFYSAHGIMGAAVVSLFIIGTLPRLARMETEGLGGTVHRTFNNLAYMLLALVIITGLVRVT